MLSKNTVNWNFATQKSAWIIIPQQSFIVCFFLFHLKKGTKWLFVSEGGMYDLNADSRLLSIHHLRSVKLVCTSFEMPPASAAKPAVQGSTEDMVGPWNTGKHSFHCTELKIILIKTNQSVQESKCIKIVWKYTRLSETFHTGQNLFYCIGFSRLSGTFSRLFGNLLKYPENYQTVRKSYQISGKLPNCPEIFHTV